MKKLKERLAKARANFAVSSEELAEASEWSAYTINLYLSGKRKLQTHTEDRFVAGINAALDRILVGRADLLTKR